MVFFKEDIEEIGDILREARQTSGAEACALIHRTGHRVAVEGDLQTTDRILLERVVPDLWRTLEKLATGTGDPHPACAYSSGEHVLQAVIVNPQTILARIFRAESPAPPFGESAAHAKRLGGLLARIAIRNRETVRVEPFGGGEPPLRRA